jgi:hypothetical protein
MNGAGRVPLRIRRVAPVAGATGGISGTVTAAAGGARLSDVTVEVDTSSGHYAGLAFTGADGTYEVTGLDPAAPGYRVCFDASDVTGGSSYLGYLSQCYRNVPWAGGYSRRPAPRRCRSRPGG